MPDIEKVIKGLEGVYLCISPVNHTCGDCPYQDNHVECIRRVLSDAIALLKDQEPVEPNVIIDTWVCGNCGTRLERQSMVGDNILFTERFDYCPSCGRKVLWGG